MEEYKYKGVELTPSIFAELMVLLFDGKQFKRQTAINDIIQYHKTGEGALEKKDYIQGFKKACRILSTKGLINIGYGTWRLNYKVQEVEIVEADKKEAINYSSEKTIGIGNNALYVYYYDTYKKYAEQNGRNSWECKIGRTDKDPLQRVFGQAGTCYPELPHIALIINSIDSSLLESTIHDILKFKNKWIRTAPGTEWFLTTPEEIEKLYYFITEGDNTSG